MFMRRLGGDLGREENCSSTAGCPDIFELEGGDIAIIGVRKTKELAAFLPIGSGCGTHEEIVVIPRQLVHNAKSDLAKILLLA